MQLFVRRLYFLSLFFFFNKKTQSELLSGLELDVCSSDLLFSLSLFFFFQAEDGIRDYKVTGVQTCALPILAGWLTRAPCQNCLWRRATSRKSLDCRRARRSISPTTPPWAATRRTSRSMAREIGRASCRERV